MSRKLVRKIPIHYRRKVLDGIKIIRDKRRITNNKNKCVDPLKYDYVKINGSLDVMDLFNLNKVVKLKIPCSFYNKNINLGLIELEKKYVIECYDGPITVSEILLRYCLKYKVSNYLFDLLWKHGVDVSQVSLKWNKGYFKNRFTKKASITVIIAAYNCEDTISRAIDSVINCENVVKIIVVDDASTDGTCDIVSGYDVELISNVDNIGPGAIRNDAIDRVDSEYFVILDSDDEYIDVGKMLVCEDCDFIVGNHRYINESFGSVSKSRNVLNRSRQLVGSEIEILGLNNFYSCGKLYKTSFIKDNDIKFSEGIYYEDTVFILSCITKANKVIFLNDVFYNCYVLEGSATREVFENDFHIFSFEKALIDVLDNVVIRDVSNAMKIIDVLDDRVKRYSYKDSSHEYNSNVRRLLKVVDLIKKKWYGDLLCFYKAEYELKCDFEYADSLHINSKDFDTKYIRVDMIQRFYQMSDVVLFMGFNFELKGNSKYLFFDYLRNSDKNVKFVSNDVSIPSFYKVIPYSKEYYYYLATACVVYVESFVDIQFRINKGAKLIQMWHGTPIKKLRYDSPDVYVKRRDGVNEDADLQFDKVCEFFSQNKYSDSCFVSGLHVSEQKLKREIYPRVKWLKENCENDYLIDILRHKYNVPTGKKVVLYAPTWRDKWLESDDRSMLLRNEFGLLDEQFEVVYLEHDYLKCQDSTHDTQELILISDLCISDYSSIIFDFLEIRKPIFLFVKDKEDYCAYRGIYQKMESTLCNSMYSSAQKMIETINDNKDCFLDVGIKQSKSCEEFLYDLGVK